MQRFRISFAPVRAVLVLAVVATVALFIPGGAESQANAPSNRILARALAVHRGQAKARKYEMPLSAGVMTALIERYAPPAVGAARGPSSGAMQPVVVPVPPSHTSNGCPNVFSGNSDNDRPASVRVKSGNSEDQGGPQNIRVNQDCTLRRQAEEWVGVNPRDFNNVLAGQNDSRIGFNHCGYDWSLNGGRTWGDTGTSPPPFWQELFSTGDTADACSDPAGTFDHLGNAYVTGVFFEVADNESSIWVAKSNWPIKGRFYHEPRQIAFQEYRTAVMGEVASDNDPDLFHDKELMQADSRPTSPKKGRVYVTWTRFEFFAAFPGQRSPIVFSQSTDGGATWSPQVIISGSNGAVCTDFSGTAGDPAACDQDQGSHPVVGPDGTIYVIFGNGNTPDPGINQVLMVKCPPANSCNSPAHWSTPVKVGDLIGTHPIGNPGNAGGCPTGRQCLPPNGYRVPEFTSMTISVDRNSNLYATWSDFRNGDDAGSTCGPFGTWSSRTPPCNNDVFYSFSTNGGATWSPTINITPQSRFGSTAQWQPWSDVAGDGSRVYAAFYDRRYGNCEFTGCNDITLATIRNPRSASPNISYRRITTSSMPNLVPANNPLQAGFLGDYMWVEVSRHNFSQRDVHIVWADTRPLFGTAPEEDIYYARIRVGEGDRD